MGAMCRALTNCSQRRQALSNLDASLRPPTVSSIRLRFAFLYPRSKTALLLRVLLAFLSPKVSFRKACSPAVETVSDSLF